MRLRLKLLGGSSWIWRAWYIERWNLGFLLTYGENLSRCSGVFQLKNVWYKSWRLKLRMKFAEAAGTIDMLARSNVP